MKKIDALFITALFLVLLLPFLSFSLKKEIEVPVYSNTVDFLAGTFFQESINVNDLKNEYKALFTTDRTELRELRKDGIKPDEVKVLIVPGHDSVHSGAQFQSVREVDLNREVAGHLYNLLKDEEGFEVVLASDEDGFTRSLDKYLDREEDEILEFRDDFQKEMKKLIKKGNIKLIEGVYHNSAPEDVAYYLYGINKYANDKDFDIVLHIHFNDVPRKNLSSPGKYSGFSLYVPESQFSNAKASQVFAEHLEERLARLFPVSDHPQESSGVVEDQDLIAIGAYNTVDAISTLVEYGYIYESQFYKNDLREVTLKELAFQTYWGIKSFFNEDLVDSTPILALPNVWTEDLEVGDKGIVDVLTLQTLLRLEGYYPPDGDLNKCPISGNFGSCTEVAVKKFQEAAGIQPTGYVGPSTRAKLNERF